jgi:2',3'-cyclic-nucleotide 2'-phosphodiesterase (5'-nucleotidase family)
MYKRISQVTLITLLAFGIIISQMMSVFSTENVVTFEILYTNNISGHIDGTDDMLGLAKFSAQVERIKPDICLDGGGSFYGTPIANLLKGQSVAQCMRYVGYDAIGVGSHDLNYGYERLLEFEETIQAPMLAGNVINEAYGSELFKKSFIIKEKNGIRVGIFGLIDETLYSHTKASSMTGLFYASTIPYSEMMVNELRTIEDCDIIICMDYTNDPTRLANGVDGIDVILAGNSDKMSCEEKNGTFIIHGAKNLHHFADIKLKYDLDLHKMQTPLTLSYTPSKDIINTNEDERVRTRIEASKDKLRSFEASEIKTLEFGLDGEDTQVYVGETNFGHVITDAYRYVTEADVAFESVESITGSLKKGDVTRGDLYNALSPENTLYVLDLSGQRLLDILEISCATMSDSKERYKKASKEEAVLLWDGNAKQYLQFSGLKFNYDPKTAVGERIWNVKIGTKALSKTATYRVALSSALFEMGSYQFLKKAHVNGAYLSCVDAVEEYLKNAYISGIASKDRMSVKNRSNANADESSSSSRKVKTSKQKRSPSTMDDSNIRLWGTLVVSIASASYVISKLKRREL